MSELNERLDDPEVRIEHFDTKEYYQRLSELAARGVVDDWFVEGLQYTVGNGKIHSFARFVKVRHCNIN